LELATPRKEPVLAVHAAAHVLSSNPPSDKVKYRIDVSTDGGKTWTPMVKDWSITRRGEEPKDFWSQSFCWGSLELSKPVTGPVRVRFSNTGGKSYVRCEAHLVYKTGGDGTRVTFAWTDQQGDRKAGHTFAAKGNSTWKVPTGKHTRTRWVE